MSATLNFGSTGTLQSLQFHIDQLEIQLGSYLTIVGTNINVDTAAWGNATATLVSFTSLGAQLQLGSISVGAGARGRSIKNGKTRAGHMGCTLNTTRNHKVVAVDTENLK